jgi:CspA family cold shock protein
MPFFGKVKWFDPKKGFGFIEQEDGTGDLFVHYSDVAGEGYRNLKEGERVKFEIADSPKGKKATQVELA